MYEGKILRASGVLIVATHLLNTSIHQHTLFTLTYQSIRRHSLLLAKIKQLTHYHAISLLNA